MCIRASGNLSNGVRHFAPDGALSVARGDAVLGVAPGVSKERVIAPDGATESPSPLPGRADPLSRV